MKAIVVFAVLVATATAFEQAADEWELWKTKHGKTYKTEREELHRRTIWTGNRAFVEEHNKHSDKFGFTVEVNRYADLENGEFVRIFNGYRQDLLDKTKKASKLHKLSGLQAPSSVDWRTKGVVTPVKNQGQCGSCWAFSTTGSLEGQHAINNGSLISLSEQQLVDCSTSYGNNGCKGGLMDNAFQYLETTKDETEEDYEYHAQDGICQYTSSLGRVSDGGYKDIESGSEDDLLDAVATVGPISVAMDASHLSFQMYKSGIYSEPECSSEKLDHGVLAVGYGETSTGEYWIVKNSWGDYWGDEGYFKLARNQNNMCGIATQASYPTGVN